MSNLLAGLAGALGAGLGGYLQAKMYNNDQARITQEQRRRDAMFQAEQAHRAALARNDRMRVLAGLAEAGITEGERPTGTMEFGGEGSGALGAHFIPKIRVDNAQRYRQVGAPEDRLYQDFTLSRAGREQGARQARERERSDERFEATREKMEAQAEQARLLQERTTLYQVAQGRGPEAAAAKARLAAMDPNYGRQLLEPPKPSGGGGGPNHQIVNQVLDDYRSGSATTGMAAMGYRTLRSQADEAVDNPAAAMGLLYAYIRLIDPTSAVKEGEYVALQKRASYDRRVQRWLQMALDGTLPAEDVRDLRAAGMAAARPWFEKDRSLRQSAMSRAKLGGFGPEFEAYMPDTWGDAAGDFAGDQDAAAPPERNPYEKNYTGRPKVTHGAPIPSHDKLYLPPLRQR